MTPFLMLPVPIQNAACLWALLICFGGIADAISLFKQKRYRYCALSALCFALGYFLLHVCREGTELRLKGQVDPFALDLLHQPAFLFLIFLALASVVCIGLYANVHRWKTTHITSASIKESVDLLPAGVCYYLEEGRCILVNHRMNDICFSLTGRSLQNGAAFYEFVKGKKVHALSDGTAVSFRHRVLSDQGAPLYELIADDITELYEKNEELRRDNEKARQLAANMKTYGETIADTVRRQEILQAKASIHDEMNRMILATKKTTDNQSDEQERREILQMWRAQALLLCKEAGVRRSRNVVSDLDTLASAIGIRLSWDGVPETESTRALTLFLSVAREAMTNAAKHAGAELFSIHVDESDTALSASFTNDGKKPLLPITENGGLKNLRERIENAGGQMQIDVTDGFALSVTIPKEEMTDAIQRADR